MTCPPFLRAVLRALDGAPPPSGPRQRGQSLFEFAISLPILILTLTGLVEIGWFANNYLILLEVSRVAARNGTVQTIDNSPLRFNNAASYHPDVQDPAGVTTTNPADLRFVARDCTLLDPANNNFYKAVACNALRTMDPLTLNTGGAYAEDDIVISVFTVNTLRTADFPVAAGDGVQTYRNRLVRPIPPADADANSRQVVVTGRWPANANECVVGNTPRAGDNRDPFDYLNNNTLDNGAGPTSHYEITPGVGNVIEADGFGGTWATFDTHAEERQRGFSWTGQRRLRNPDGTPTGCIGSEFSLDDMQTSLNMPVLALTDAERNASLPPFQGVVLVEIFWEHRPLLNLFYFDFFRSVQVDPGDPASFRSPMIYVWSAFPAPVAEVVINRNAAGFIVEFD